MGMTDTVAQRILIVVDWMSFAVPSCPPLALVGAGVEPVLSSLATASSVGACVTTGWAAVVVVVVAAAAVSVVGCDDHAVVANAAVDDEATACVTCVRSTAAIRPMQQSVECMTFADAAAPPLSPVSHL